MKIALDWNVGFSSSPDIRPEKMVAATVPGNANLDWIMENNLPDWKYGTNYQQYLWMEDIYWLYEAKIPPVDTGSDEVVFFVSEGIDYECEILLDGQDVYKHEGMFSEINIPVDGKKEQDLQIWISPPPKDTYGEENTRAEAAQSCKPAVSYGWDWHPRFIPSGIWQDTYIKTCPAIRFTDTSFNYEMNESCTSVEVSFDYEISRDVKSGNDSSCPTNINVTALLFAPDGSLVLTIPNKETRQLDSPKLWWCNGYGEPKLYTWEASLSCDGNVVDTATGKVGFRKIELTMGEGTWDVPNHYPMSRSPAPATITLNGVAVFAKGSNWVNPEIFTGTIAKDTYLPLIKLAAQANFNLLRCWGGAIINKKSFFDLCDEYGIMIWQDFPLACNDYRGTQHYLKILQQEASAIIKKLRHHPCLVLWCGGNELLNSWSKMTDQSLALRLLNKICFELDRERPFITSAPLDGMAHGNYVFRYTDGREVYQAMTEANNTAYTEFGVPSFSNLSCIKMFAEESDVFPVIPNDITIAHHAFFAFDGNKTRWACLDIIRHYFGDESSLNDLVTWSQWLQGEGYRCIYEESRRQKPFCSMALNWCYNEPWPALANNSIINYPAEPKASFKDITAACRPVLISAKIPKFMWHNGECFSIELWLLNDSLSLVPAGVAIISVEIDGGIIGSDKWEYEESPANTNVQGPVMEFNIPDIADEGVKELTLRIDAGEMTSVYRLLYRELKVES